MTLHRTWLIGLVLLTSCLPGRRARPVPPPETAATLRARTDSLYLAGRQHFRQGRWTQAIETLDRALAGLEADDWRRLAGRFMIGEAQLAAGNPLLAVRDFRRVADEAPSDTLAAEALLRAGDAYAQLWRKPQLDPTYGESALATYRELTSRYPNTPAARRAGLRIQELQEQFADKEYRTALFYYRLKAYDSAILSLRHVIATYPRTRIVPEALVRLIEAYRALNYAEDVRETCDYVREFFPEVVSRVSRHCPVDPAGRAEGQGGGD